MVYWVAECWNEITNETIANLWNKLLKNDANPVIKVDKNEEILTLIRNLPEANTLTQQRLIKYKNKKHWTIFLEEVNFIYVIVFKITFKTSKM